MKLGERSFLIAGPTTWNSLPETVREAVRAVTVKTSFKRLFKTHFFTITFNSSTTLGTLFGSARCRWGTKYSGVIIIIIVTQFSKINGLGTVIR